MCILEQALGEKTTAEQEMSEGKCTIKQLQMNNNEFYTKKSGSCRET